MAQSRYYTSTAQPTVLVASITPSSTVVQVQAVTGFPVSFPYVIALGYGTSSEELALVTSAVGTSLTVTRSFDGTSASSHNAGDPVRHTWSGADGNDSRLHESLSSGVHGVTGTVVGTTDTQTLTNKTFTNPTINSASLSGTVSGGPTFSGTPTFSTTLYRQSASTNTAESIRVTGDGNDRMNIRADGQVTWGDGTASGDTNLYRAAANQLKTDDDFFVNTGGRLRLQNVTDVSISSTNHAFQIGPDNGANIRMDGNEIMAVNNGVVSTLDVQSDGGNLRLFNNTPANLQVQGGEIITNTFGASATPLQVKGSAGQTAALLQIQDSGSTNMFQVAATGGISGPAFFGPLYGLDPDADSTTSTSYVSLDTKPEITFIAPPSGSVIVAFGACAQNSTTTNSVRQSFEVRNNNSAGAVFLAPDDNRGWFFTGITAIVVSGSFTYRVDGLTPGNTYFTRPMQLVTGGTGVYDQRWMTVTPCYS